MKTGRTEPTAPGLTSVEEAEASGPSNIHRGKLAPYHSRATLTKPDGITVLKRWTPTTSSTGTVKVSLTALTTKGVYKGTAAASKNGLPGIAETNFPVQ